MGAPEGVCVCVCVDDPELITGVNLVSLCVIH